MLFGKLKFPIWIKDKPFWGRPKGGYLLLEVPSSETVSFFLPFLLREANTLRPLAVAILSRKPCLFFLFLREGWNVRFIILSVNP